MITFACRPESKYFSLIHFIYLHHFIGSYKYVESCSIVIMNKCKWSILFRIWHEEYRSQPSSSPTFTFPYLSITCFCWAGVVFQPQIWGVFRHLLTWSPVKHAKQRIKDPCLKCFSSMLVCVHVYIHTHAI